jgi:hypothetical protein
MVLARTRATVHNGHAPIGRHFSARYVDVTVPRTLPFCSRHKTPSASPHFKHGTSFTTNTMRMRENSVLRSTCGYSTDDVALRISNTLPAKRTYRVAKPAPAQTVRRSKRLEEQGRRRFVADDTRCLYHLPSPESDTNIKAVCKCDLGTEYRH